MCIVMQAGVIWVGSEIWTARIISAMDCCPCPDQTLLWGLSLLCPYSGALPLAFATLVLVWSFTTDRHGMSWLFTRVQTQVAVVWPQTEMRLLLLCFLYKYQ